MIGESGESPPIPANITRNETEAPEIEHRRHPLISDGDWKIYNLVLAQIRKDGEEEPHPSKTDVKGFTRAADIDGLTREAEEAKTYSMVSSALDEAHRINVARDRAIRFGLNPDKADDPVFQINLEVAEDICNKLGLDGKTVCQDPDTRSALENLIRTEIQMKDAAREVTTAKAALTRAQKDLHKKESELTRQQGEQVAGRHALMQLAKPNSPDKTSTS